MADNTPKKSTTTEMRRIQLTRVAARLFLKYGIANTSVRELAKALGITTGGLYHYISSKNDIINLVVESGIHTVEELKEFKQSLGNIGPALALKECIIYWLLKGEARRDYLVFYNRETLSIEPRMLQELMQAVRDVVKFFESLIIEGVKKGELQVDDPTLLAFNVWSLEQEWALRRWLLKDLFTIEEYASKQADAILKQAQRT